MDKEKIKQQRAKLKENALKVLHVLCYILSGLFLLTLLISGLQSCGGKTATGTSAETIDDYTYTYTAPQFVKETNYQFMANSPEQYYAWLTETLGEHELPQDSNKYDYYACAEDTYIEFTDTDGNKYGANNIRFHYAVHTDGVGNTGWLLDYVDLCIKVTTPVGTSAYTNVYVWCATNSNTGLVVFSQGKFTMPVKIDLPYVFDYTEVSNKHEVFEFNKVFNYNAPLGLGLTQQFGANISYATDIGGIYRITINTGRFLSNNSFYDAIVVDYLNAGACTYQIDGVLRNGTQDNLSYFALGYRREGESLIDFINYRDNANGYKDNSAITYVISSTTWVNDSYRYITLYDSLSHEVEIKLNSFNNNNQNAYNGSSVGNEVTNVFTLVASAFTGLLPILSVYILPSVTLGTLLFVPLVATIVFVIIKTIKK